MLYTNVNNIGGQLRPAQHVDRCEQRKRKIGFFYFQVEQFAEAAQIGGRRQQLGHVSKVDAGSSANGRQLITPSLQFGVKSFFV